MLNCKMTVMACVVLSVGIVALTGCGPAGDTVEQKRDNILSMEDETLERLYEEEPPAKRKIARAAGYGVFSNVNINLIFASAGSGYGVVYDNDTGDRTYMRMALGGIGIGLGAKDFRVVLIFKTDEAMRRFIQSGWEFGAHADAAAKAGDKGGELSDEGDISSDIDVYSMTESGLALQATVAGSKYWKDDELN